MIWARHTLYWRGHVLVLPFLVQLAILTGNLILASALYCCEVLLGELGALISDFAVQSRVLAYSGRQGTACRAPLLCLQLILAPAVSVHPQWTLLLSTVLQ